MTSCPISSESLFSTGGEKVARLKAEKKPVNPGLRALYSLAHFAVFHPLKKRLRLERTRLAKVEQVKKFKILTKRLEEEDGEVTPTMKVKRKQIEQAYADLIESIYTRKKKQ